MARIDRPLVERGILTTLMLVVAVLAVLHWNERRQQGASPRTPDPTVAVAPTEREPPTGEAAPAPLDRVPRAEATELLEIGAQLQPPSVPDPLPRPLLGWDSLSSGLPTEGQWRGSSLLADLDGDGHLDLVTSMRRWDRATPGEGLMVYRGDGAGHWTPAVDGMRRDMGYGGSAVADVDGDGHLDLAFSGHDVTPHVFLADGAGGWRSTTAGIDITGMCADVALGDVDRDGLPDLATLGFQRGAGGLTLFVGVGGGTFARMLELLPDDVFGAQLRMPDLDGDGYPEIVASSSAGPKVWRFADGELVDLSNGLPAPEIGGSDIGIDARDLDGDGFAELLVTGMVYDGHAPLRLYRWDGSQWQPWGTGLPDDESFFDGRFARLGGGDDTWLALAGRAGIGIVRMTAPGVFESLGRLEDTEGVFNLAVGDVDADGRDEIAFVGVGGVRVLRPQIPASALAMGDRS